MKIFNLKYNHFPKKSFLSSSSFLRKDPFKPFHFTSLTQIKSFHLSKAVLFNENKLVDEEQILNFKPRKIRKRMSKTQLEKKEKTKIEKKSISAIEILYGLNHQQDVSKSRKLCVESSLEGNHLSTGLRYYFGWEVDVDFKQSFKIFFNIFNNDKKMKKESTVYAVCFLSQQFRYGKGTPKNVELAFELLKKAASKKNSLALQMLAKYYWDNIGDDHHQLLAIETLKEAAEMNNTYALLNLGFIYHFGQGGVGRDLHLAICYYERAIQFKVIDALFLLGKIFVEEEAFISNRKQEGMSLIEESIKQGDSRAMVYLGDIYEFGKFGFEKDIQKAIFLYQIASDLNDSEAMFHLGSLHEKGDVVEKDENKALELFKTSATMENVHSSLRLSEIFENHQSPSKK